MATRWGGSPCSPTAQVGEEQESVGGHHPGDGCLLLRLSWNTVTEIFPVIVHSLNGHNDQCRANLKPGQELRRRLQHR